MSGAVNQCAPVTPCAPGPTVAFVERYFGASVAACLDPSARAASARERRITELRRVGELRHAERYGWLSLTGWLLGMKVKDLGKLDPTSEAIQHRAGGTDVLDDPLADDPAPVLTTVPHTDLDVSDPRDLFGFGVLELAVSALRDGMVEVGGRPVGGGAVTESLRARLGEVARV
jgi:hypothetical protein